jgi:MFS family permease
MSLMRVHFGKLWQNRDFLKLWTGETISYIGSEVTLLALPLTAVLFLKANAIQMGILGAMDYLPFLFFALFIGIWVDKYRRRPILIMADLGRAFLLLLIPLLALIGALRMEYLLIITFLIGIFSVFFNLAYQSFLPSLVHREHLMEGNSKLAVSQSFSEIAGPGLAGLLIQIIAAPFVLLFDALSFLVSATSLWLIHTREPEPMMKQEQQDKEHLFKEMRAGFQITFGNKCLRAFAAEATHYNLFWQIIQTLFILYAIRDLHIAAGFIGIIFAIGSAGGLLGVFLTNYTARRFGVGYTIVGATMLGCIPPLVIPFVSGSGVTTLIVLSCAFFILGAGVTGCNVHVTSMRQAITPDHLLGRMNSIYRLITMGVIPAAALLGGLLGEWIGLRSTLLISTIALALDFLWILLSPIPRMYELPKTFDELQTIAEETPVSS